MVTEANTPSTTINRNNKSALFPIMMIFILAIIIYSTASLTEQCLNPLEWQETVQFAASFSMIVYIIIVIGINLCK